MRHVRSRVILLKLSGPIAEVCDIVAFEGPRPINEAMHCLLPTIVSHVGVCVRTSKHWSLVERKKPRNIYLGGRTKVYHLLLVGRYQEKAYKQRAQIEVRFSQACVFSYLKGAQGVSHMRIEGVEKPERARPWTQG